MILLDHNVPQDQLGALRRAGIRVSQIGFEVGRPEWLDQQEILRYLHELKQTTFVTRDLGFYRRRFSHPRYCVVVVAGRALETAAYIRHFLRHKRFRTKASRMGLVVKLLPATIVWWEPTRSGQTRLKWVP